MIYPMMLMLKGGFRETKSHGGKKQKQKQQVLVSDCDAWSGCTSKLLVAFSEAEMCGNVWKMCAKYVKSVETE